MPPDLNSHPLIAWAQRPEINQVSRFVAACEQLTDDVLVAAYQAERTAAPQRALAGKRYLTTARQGFPHTTDVSNRGEEHLALAIFNAYGGKPIATPDGELLRVGDYQVPLKAQRDDAGVGKYRSAGADSDRPGDRHRAQGRQRPRHATAYAARRSRLCRDPGDHNISGARPRRHS